MATKNRAFFDLVRFAGVVSLVRPRQINGRIRFGAAPLDSFVCYLPLIVVSVLCFLASLTVHILGWMQMIPPGGQTVMFLHVFIFVLFIPLFFLLKRPGVQKTAIDEFLELLPKWPLRLTQFLFFYAIAHFVFFIYQTSHYPKNGVPAYLQIRGFSGHWMVFYAVCALGYAELRRRLIANNKADVRAA